MQVFWYFVGAMALVSVAMVLWDRFRYPNDETEVDKDDERFGRSI